MQPCARHWRAAYSPFSSAGVATAQVQAAKNEPATAGDADAGPIAPLRLRFAAMLYDALLVLAMWVTTIVALVTLTGDAVLGAWVQSLLFLEAYALFAFCWCRRGQTLGMAAWRLRLASDGPFTPGQALRRFVAGFASFATLGLGFFWMWLDAEGRTWPDRFSRSTVVRTPKPRR